MFEGLPIYATTIMLPHRDCNSNNIMMDGAHLFPQGFHPQRQDRKSDFKSTAPYYTRTRLPVKYYLTDFGLSCRYDPANGPPWEDIRDGDNHRQEHTGRAACDPFPTNIYFLGSLIHRHFLDATILQRYRIFAIPSDRKSWQDGPNRMSMDNGGSSLCGLSWRNMVKAGPTQHSTIDEVVARFADIEKELSTWDAALRGQLANGSFRYCPNGFWGIGVVEFGRL
ncbi:hypothetical protein B0H14DRAFT_2968126 [Mycena olivaceomarginata]|nr:hypothetical protein B0H14DRAFT_2968126 [Mycena olivaceomarginata]